MVYVSSYAAGEQCLVMVGQFLLALRFLSILFIHLFCCKLSGDLASLCSLIHLERMRLHTPHVTGEVESLEGLVAIQALDLHLHFSALVCTLPRMDRLDFLSLKHASPERTTDGDDFGGGEGGFGGAHTPFTVLTGPEAPPLREVHVDASLMRDTDALALLAPEGYPKWGSLERLCITHPTNWLQNSLIGPLRAVALPTSLLVLNLHGCNGVSGVLSDVSHLKVLDQLDLSRTRMRGDIAALQAMASLGHVNLSRTLVTGSIEVLRRCPRLQNLNLSYTQVGGDGEEFLRDSCSSLQLLERLELSWTLVSGSAEMLLRLAMQASPEIASLNLFGCPSICGYNKLLLDIILQVSANENSATWIVDCTCLDDCTITIERNFVEV